MKCFHKHNCNDLSLDSPPTMVLTMLHPGAGNHEGSDHRGSLRDRVISLNINRKALYLTKGPA